MDQQTCLVHGDFGNRNLLVRRGPDGWAVAAVLDWEYALAGSPLIDLGHFLRYERTSRPFAEPWLSQGYRDAGGVLPSNWRFLSRAAGLTALCRSLANLFLTDAVIPELIELVASTICANPR
jgi:aminoglycoside phosphotransferase (APT) family kinase protein